MKKRSLKKLELKKATISTFEKVTGGLSILVRKTEASCISEELGCKDTNTED